MKRAIIGAALLLGIWYGGARLWSQGPGGSAQTVTLADITGTGATVCLGSYIPAGQVNARWIQLITPSTNSAAVRVGYGATSSHGAAVAPGGGFFWPPLATPGVAVNTNFYALSSACMYIGSGDSVTVSYLP